MLWAKLAKRPKGDMSMFKKTALGIILVGISYIVMVVADKIAAVNGQCSVFWLALVCLLMSVGELSLIHIFFSAITPSASGGQPMQIYYMRKNKIPIPVSTLVLMIVTITYKSVLVVIGLFVAFFQRGFVHRYLEGILPVFYLGVALNVGCCIAMSVLAFHPALAKWIMMKCLKLLERLRILKYKPERTLSLIHI